MVAAYCIDPSPPVYMDQAPERAIIASVRGCSRRAELTVRWRMPQARGNPMAKVGDNNATPPDA